MKLKSIGVMSFGVNTAVVCGLIGLLAGLAVALLSLMGPSGGGVAQMGLLSVVIVPLIYLVSGFILGVISAVIYNLTFRWTGGLELNLE